MLCICVFRINNRLYHPGHINEVSFEWNCIFQANAVIRNETMVEKGICKSLKKMILLTTNQNQKSLKFYQKHN